MTPHQTCCISVACRASLQTGRSRHTIATGFRRGATRRGWRRRSWRSIRSMVETVADDQLLAVGCRKAAVGGTVLDAQQRYVSVNVRRNGRLVGRVDNPEGCLEIG